MKYKFYNQNNYKGSVTDIYNTLNIDRTNLHEQERHDKIKNKLETLKMNNGTITLEDDSTLNVNDIDKVEIINHNMAKPTLIQIYG